MGLEYLWEWSMFALRWLHIVTAIAWIGSSFYFIALDLGLKTAKSAPAGVLGEEWQVHGGGFYHIQKYGVAPDHMPDDLVWFKWEAYTTWLSGFALLSLMYYAGAHLYLIDPAVMPLSVGQAITISLLVLAAGWIVYDQLCKRLIEAGDTTVFIILFLFMCGVGFVLTHVFSGRGAFIHVGAMTATIMAANVAMVIIPNQRIVVADLIAGRKPDAKYGKIAKQRSLHNNYLTLPVIFFFLANHYPLATSTRFSWLIIAVVLVLGAVIRHYFNTKHATGRHLVWTWVVTVALFLVIVGLSTYPLVRTMPTQEAAGVRFDPMDSQMRALVRSDAFPAAQNIILSRCSMCHAAQPMWEGMVHPPLGVTLESEYDIAREASRIARQAVLSHAMPPGNVTGMTDEEREQVRRWLADG
ncbi:urate hydroxylase PuuD [Acuticoccus sp. I52.16.1]|uniref:urate hydroxylase PuuD n=1 Tax=Acuticoccus sp. I52.16.1 TaxID=2928472 RepID=UPI001FD2F88A|nr:urate hydroxylase PuuD [Acuticoccus sp. I52.16.1]UOM36448.1 urate hydroxylase PuuD [Acuticoccus sp. I52.16.1]